MDFPLIEYNFFTVKFSAVNNVLNTFGQAGWMLGGFQYIPSDNPEIMIGLWRAKIGGKDGD